MSIAELIYKFRHDLIAATGIDAPIVRIDFTHEAFTRLMHEVCSRPDGHTSLRLAHVNDNKIFDIRVNARERLKDD